jgi:hypothetical protein
MTNLLYYYYYSIPKAFDLCANFIDPCALWVDCPNDDGYVPKDEMGDETGDAVLGVFDCLLNESMYIIIHFSLSFSFYFLYCDSPHPSSLFCT